MRDQFDSACAPRDANFLWVNLTRQTSTALSEIAGHAFDVHCLRDTSQISAAVERHAPLFFCFEFDVPDTPGIIALADTRRTHPSLPVLMITGCHSDAMTLWALRIRVWDLLLKPVLSEELWPCLTALIELTRQGRSGPAREIRFPQRVEQALPAPNGPLLNPLRKGRTHAAILHVTTHFDCKIALEQAAALCRLSPTQFCRLFRQEQGVSFGQHLLRYRLEQACQRLAHSGALVKDVAYSVGFNDLSYFTRAFKRQLGVCPSDYQAGARLS